MEPKQVDVESLNQKANDLAKDSTPEHAAVVKEPMSNVNKRWDNLLEGLGDREVRIVYLAKDFQSVQQQKIYPTFHFGKLK